MTELSNAYGLKKYFFDKKLMKYCEKGTNIRFLKLLNEKMFLCKMTIKSYKNFWALKKSLKT